MNTLIALKKNFTVQKKIFWCKKSKKNIFNYCLRQNYFLKNFKEYTCLEWRKKILKAFFTQIKKKEFFKIIYLMKINFFLWEKKLILKFYEWKFIISKIVLP